MKKNLLNQSPLNDCVLSIISVLLRLAVASAMLTHGIPKILNFATLSTNFPDPLAIGSTMSLALSIGAEVGCSLLLILGLFTRLALLPLLFNMTMVVFVVQAHTKFASRELAIMYLMIYIAIFAIGAGKYSLDKLISKK